MVSLQRLGRNEIFGFLQFKLRQFLLATDAAAGICHTSRLEWLHDM